jgi:DNA-binding beta-propeller fold protein YncE
MFRKWSTKTKLAVLSAGLFVLVLSVAVGVQQAQAPSDPWAAAATAEMPQYKWDPSWPKPLPNKWKMGGITGLAVDRNDNVWVLTRPNDTVAGQEDHAMQNPPQAACCVRPPAMIHIDRQGNVIGSIDVPQGHGMDVDSRGFVYVGNNIQGKGSTVRKYDPKTGRLIAEIPRIPEIQPANPPAAAAAGGGRGGAAAGRGGGRGGAAGGRGGAAQGGGRGGAAAGGRGGAPPPDPAAQALMAENARAAVAAFRAKYPPQTPMIVGNTEEVRIDEPANEIYVADSYLGGRIMVFDLETFAFKRGWGAYGKPLAQISTNEADHDYTPGGPMPKDFAGHLTFNFSNDGMVYMADRNANRIQVTDKQGRYQNKEFVIAPMTGEGGSTGGVAFSPDRAQRHLYISDLTNNTIWFLNREDGKLLGRFGSMGENGGQFFGLHMIAVDSRGYIYTGEVFNGERAQRFVPANTSISNAATELVSRAPVIPNDPWSVTPAANMPRYRLDPTWPKALPNKWKMGGVTGLAVDRNDNVWVLNRPNDTTDLEGHRGLNPPTSDCCVRPPAMIHIDKDGNVIGSFEAPQGHGMDVDSQGFVYIGNNDNARGLLPNVRKYDPRTGQMVKETPRAPEAQPGGGAANAEAVRAFRMKYPPQSPMVVGGTEEIRIDEAARELYVADNYLGGRILVFDLETFAFKRGWGSYGKPLSEISLNEADHDYTPNGPMPKDFAGHLTFNFSADGMVYMADRNANRIQVTDKQGRYQNKEFIVAPHTGAGGSTGGVAFSPDRQNRFLFISDLTNNTIWFLNRADGKILGRMGSMGDNAGQFYGLHMIAVDSRGYIYTGDVQNGERVQRFIPVR